MKDIAVFCIAAHSGALVTMGLFGLCNWLLGTDFPLTEKTHYVLVFAWAVVVLVGMVYQGDKHTRHKRLKRLVKCYVRKERWNYISW